MKDEIYAAGCTIAALLKDKVDQATVTEVVRIMTALEQRAGGDQERVVAWAEKELAWLQSGATRNLAQEQEAGVFLRRARRWHWEF